MTKVQELASKSRRTQDDRSAETREKLISGAYRVLLERGHVGLRSANISAAAGISRGGLLHHYPTKELLIAAVYEEINNRMEAASLERIAAVGDDEILRAIVEDARERFFSDAFRVTLDILIASGEEEPLSEVLHSLRTSKHSAAPLEWAGRLVQVGVRRALAVEVVNFLWHAVKGLSVRRFIDSDDEHDGRVIAFALALAANRISTDVEP